METLNDSTIENFAAAVRAELADLPKREVAELTDGLEADLQDRLAEEGSAFAPGSPAKYAADLREAAGVAPKNVSRKYFSVAAFNKGFTEWSTRTSFGRAIYDFTVSLRPVWWVSRAVVAYIIAETLSRSNFSLWFLPLLILISIQWGRKQWLTQKFFTAILLPLNLLAMVLLVPTSYIVQDKVMMFDALQNWAASAPDPTGLRLNGVAVTEIKAYDRNHNEVTGLTFQDSSGDIILPSESTPGAIRVPVETGRTIAELQQDLTAAGINNVEFNRLDNGLDDEVRVVSTTPAAGAWIDPTSTLLVKLATPKY
jgi:hypothetical protein